MSRWGKPTTLALSQWCWAPRTHTENLGMGRTYAWHVPKASVLLRVIVLQTDLKRHRLQKLPVPTLVPLHFPHHLLEGVSGDFVAHGR